MPLLAACLLGLAASAQEKPRLHTLPGGQRLVVLDRPSQELVGLATFVGAGLAGEGSGEEGLGAVLAHASLTGTRTLGSGGWEQESQALRERDALLARVARLQARGGEPEPADQERLASLEARLTALGAPLAWLSALERLPAGRLHAWATPAGFGLEADLPAGPVAPFFALEADRLARPALRGVVAEASRLRAERARAWAEDPGLRARAVLLASAFRHSALRRSLAPPPPGPLLWGTALAFWQREVLPERVVFALVGPCPEGFLERLELLFPAGGEPPAAPAPLPALPESDQAGAREQHDLPEDPPRALLAWRLPLERDAAVLAVLADLLGHPGRGALGSRLLHGQGVLAGVQVQAPFPDPGDPALFLIEALPRVGETALQARDRVLEHLATWKPDDPAVAEARGRVAGALLARRTRPGALAAELAEGVARGQDAAALLELPARLEAVTRDQVLALAARLFATERRTILTTGFLAEGQGGNP